MNPLNRIRGRKTFFGYPKQHDRPVKSRRISSGANECADQPAKMLISPLISSIGGKDSKQMLQRVKSRPFLKVYGGRFHSPNESPANRKRRKYLFREEK